MEVVTLIEQHMEDDRVAHQRLERSINSLGDKVDLLRVDVAKLKVKAGIWGAVAGMIPGVMALVMWILTWK